MNIYKCSFRGRKSGAIGITYQITATVESETPLTDEQVRQALYEKPHNYEWISQLTINGNLYVLA